MTHRYSSGSAEDVDETTNVIMLDATETVIPDKHKPTAPCSTDKNSEATRPAEAEKKNGCGRGSRVRRSNRAGCLDASC